MQLTQRIIQAALLVSGLGTLFCGVSAVIDSTNTSMTAWTALWGSVFAVAGFAWSYPRYLALSPHDQQLFSVFKALFAEKGLIRTYREHHFLDPFKREYTKPLFTVVETWDDALHSFSNRKLEKLRQTFLKRAEELAEAITKNTVPEGTSFTVFTRFMDRENPSEQVRAEAEEIQNRVKPFIEAHDALLREGHQLGAVTPPKQQPQYPVAPDIPITASSLFAFMTGNARLNDLTHAMAERRRLKVETITRSPVYIEELVERSGIKTVRELDNAVAQYGKLASVYCNYWSPQGAIHVGFLLQHVLTISVIEHSGIEGLRKFHENLKYTSTAPAEELYEYYEEAKATLASSPGT